MAVSSSSSANSDSTQSVHAPGEISLLELMIVVGHKKYIVAITLTVTFLIGALLSFLLPSEYTAETTLLPPQQQNSLSSMLASTLGGLGPMASLAGHDLGLKNPNDMYVAMFRSQTVEDAMIRKYDLMHEYHLSLLSKARKRFEKNSKVDGSSKDGLIHISVTDRDPRRAAELANGYVAEFRDLSNGLAITDASQRRLFFEQQMQLAKNKLTKAQEALVQTEQTSGMIEVSSQARALIQSAAELKAQMTSKEVEIHGMESFAAPENPNLVEAKQELQALQSQLAKLAGNGSNANSDLILPKGKLPAAGLDYIRKYRDVQYYQTIFDILAKQFEMAKLDEAREGALIQVVDPAIPPDQKSSPKRILILTASAASGLFFGILLALAAAAFEKLNNDPISRAQLDSLRRAYRPGPLKL